MSAATHIFATVMGVYGGVLGAVHGYHELMQVFESPTSQSAQRPDGLVFNAIGDCQPDTVAHACYPAMSLIPNLTITGGLALALGLLCAILAAVGIGRRHSAKALIVLAVLLMLFGGGFFAPTYVLLAGSASAYLQRPNKPPTPPALRPVACLWPAIFIAFWTWIAVQIVLFDALNETLLALGPMLVPLQFFVVAVMFLSAAIHDDIQIG